MADGLGERQAHILRAVVREYIRTGEPVGSKHLLDRIRLDISAATVRNEMARLEELGYLGHPHTSAGRTPTDAGYRFVVDAIKNPRPLSEGQRKAIEEELATDAGDIDEILRRAGDVLSRFTRHATALLAQRARSAKLRRVEMMRAGPRRARIIAIAENGRVEQQIVALEDDRTEDELRAGGERITAEHGGKDLEGAIASLQVDDPAVAEVCRGLRDAEQHVIIGGVANLAGDDHLERETLTRLYEALERQTQVLELLATSIDERFAVHIGAEIGDELTGISMVSAPFGPSADASGSVGVIGPSRMDYERVIATAAAVARLIEGTLGPVDDA